MSIDRNRFKPSDDSFIHWESTEYNKSWVDFKDKSGSFDTWQDFLNKYSPPHYVEADHYKEEEDD